MAAKLKRYRTRPEYRDLFGEIYYVNTTSLRGGLAPDGSLVFGRNELKRLQACTGEGEKLEYLLLLKRCFAGTIVELD